MPRSSLDAPSATARENVSETFNWIRQWKNRARRLFGLDPEQPYKLEKYRRGAPVTLDVSAFFAPAPEEGAP